MTTQTMTKAITTKNPLESLISLDHQAKIFVPSTTDATETCDNSNMVEFVQIELAMLFGGFTTYKANGGWVSDEHGLISEPVTIVSANFTNEQYTNGNLQTIIDIAKKVCKDMSQEAVSMEIDGKLYFIA